MSMVSCTKKAHVVFKCQANLGEGPVWLAQSKELVWVDINQGRVYCFNPRLQKNETIYQGIKPGCVVPVKGGGLMVADLHDLVLIKSNSPDKMIIASVEQSIPGNRFNDGKVDPLGRLWVGTMSMKVIPKAGALYSVDGKGKVTTKVKNTTISNGMAWSNDLRVMYYIDTADGVVYAFDVDNVTGNISNQRIVIEIPSSMGAPDGMTIDEEGNLWIALWGGASVTKWNPMSGKLLQTIKVDAPNVTCCTFGGENMDMLFITTAREGLSSEQLKKYPLSGSLFCYKTNTSGLVPDEFLLKL